MKNQNKQEASRLIEEIVKAHDSLSYSELKKWIEEKKIETKEISGDSGIMYQVELQAIWDGKSGGAIRFLGSIYDGSSSRFLKIKTPITKGFLKEDS